MNMLLNHPNRDDYVLLCQGFGIWVINTALTGSHSVN